MASTEVEEYPTLSKVFDQYLKDHGEIENSDLPTNSEEFQGKVTKTIKGLEEATVMVSQLGVFSTNEMIEEVPTSSVKFLLLPVLLGSLTLKQVDIERREELLKTAEVYYHDFINRCHQYGITQVVPPPKKEGKEPRPPKAGMPTPEDLQRMTRQREEKIQRYRERKAISERLIEMKKALEAPSHDEEVARDFYITLIKKFIYDSLEELESLEMELSMLELMSKAKEAGITSANAQNKTKKSFQPILITRDEVQKKVFGAGYPSLPVLSVEEFYEQRVREGIFPDPNNKKCKKSMSLLDRANAGTEYDKACIEKENAEKEAKEERDDEETLAYQRSKDEWKDVHRRGWGNTYNRS
ncbi:immunoglobulin-binding protein 1-like isoform X1 [Oratosquilla oratoria]|uniref:immunoglobulin-binding protein 1-like isoform X1 n=1 Tax=Oratosquilla oratoria TaxID=337810 RepID=UPI003F76E969